MSNHGNNQWGIRVKIITVNSITLMKNNQLEPKENIEAVGHEQGDVCSQQRATKFPG